LAKTVKKSFHIIIELEMEMMPLKIHREQPDAILMDVQMPNKTVIRLQEIRN
jgi:CheY-like chemotaxis protein